MPKNAGKHVSESFKFQMFPGEHAPGPPRGACCGATCCACYVSTIHFSRLLSSDQTPIALSNDNPALSIKLLFSFALWKLRVALNPNMHVCIRFGT